MSFKKVFKTVAATFFLIAAAALQAQSIKDYVCIVKPVASDSDKEFASSIQKQLNDKGYVRYGDSIETWKKGSFFGSGFVYVGQDSKPYIITNLHVMTHFSTAEVSFEDSESGEMKSYKNLKVVAVSDDIDVCVLSFTEGGENFKKGLVFAQSKIEDGTEVWSAGFPGLGGKPLWQLGKGNVTNGSAAIKELIDPSVSRVIQHSANVDGGNSGGPLLIANKGSGFKYAVAGVNTWKARYRDGTNFSIPGGVVKTFADNAIKNQEISSDKKNDVINNIAKALDEGEKDYNFTYLLKYVSYELASKTPVPAFVDTMKYGSSSVRGSVSELFQSDPFEGMRGVAAYKIISKYHDQEVKDALDFASKLEFAVESGVYRIAGPVEESAETTKKDKKSNKKSKSTTAAKTSGFAFNGISSGEPEMSVAVGLLNVLSASLKPEFADEYADCENDDGSFGEFRYGTNIFSIGFGIENFELNGESYTCPSAGAILGLPVDFNIAVVKPFIKGCMGINFDIFKIGYETGCELYIGTQDWVIRPGFGVSFGGAWLPQDFDEYKTTTLKLYGIIAF